MSKHFYRLLNKGHEAYRYRSNIPDVLIFRYKIGEDGRSYSYPDNHPDCYYYHRDLQPLPDEEAKAYLAEMKKTGPCEVLKKSLQQHANGDRQIGGVCSFAVQDDDGIIISRLHAPCHAGFDGKGSIAAATWDSYHLTKKTKESVRELYEWMMNDSPWLHCIHPSWDILSAQERTDRAINGPVLLNVEAPANEVVGFAVALRTISEHSWTVDTYLELRKFGASKAIAFMLCGTLSYCKDEGWKYYANGNWHHFMSSSQNAEDLCKFFKNGYFLPKRRMDKFKEGKYNYVARQITSEGCPEDNSIGGVVKKYSSYSGSGWGKAATPNPQAIIEFINGVWKNV